MVTPASNQILRKRSESALHEQGSSQWNLCMALDHLSCWPRSFPARGRSRTVRNRYLSGVRPSIKRETVNTYQLSVFTFALSQANEVVQCSPCARSLR